MLHPHFFHRAMEERGGKTPSLREVAALMTPENIAEFYETQGVDFNRLDNLALRYLRYLRQHGPASEATLSQALGLTHKQDSVEISEPNEETMLPSFGLTQGHRTDGRQADSPNAACLLYNVTYNKTSYRGFTLDASGRDEAI